MTKRGEISGRNTRVLVAGVGGFIGRHLVTYPKNLGYCVSASISGGRSSRPRRPMSSASSTCANELQGCVEATREID